MMRTGISFAVTAKDRLRLEAVISQPSSPQKHVWRCRIVLLSGEAVGTHSIMATTIARQGIRRMPERGGKSKTCVWPLSAIALRSPAGQGVAGAVHGRRRPLSCM